MLARVGVSSQDELMASVPAGLRSRAELKLPPALDERALLRFVGSYAAENANVQASSELPRRRRLPPLHSRRGRRARQPRRVHDRVHALSGRDQPGHAADDLRVPDPDLSAHGARGRERLALRRRVRGRRGGADGGAASAAGHGSVSAPACTRTGERCCDTYAEGVGLERITLPLDPSGRTRLDALPGELAAVVVQSPNFVGAIEDLGARLRAPRTRAARSRSPRPPRRSRSRCSARPASSTATSPAATRSRSGCRSRSADPTRASSPRARSTCASCPGG